MLEQFRILTTALRLREFFAADLARESGVSENTVYRTLSRRTDLFSSSKGPSTGRPGGQLKLYRIKEEALKDALQSEADAIALPSPDDNLGAILAEDTMRVALPRSSPEEREKLIIAVGEHLKLVRGTDLNPTLVELYTTLKTIIQVERWLTDQQTFRKDATHQAVVWILGAIQSQQQRDARQSDRSHFFATVEKLSSFPVDVALLAKRFDVTNAIGDSLVKPPPLPRWWLALPAAVWTLLRNELWTHIAGDLANPGLLSATPNRSRPDSASGHAVVVGSYATFGSRALSRNAVYTIDLMSKPHFHGSVITEFGPSSSQSTDFSELATGLVRVRADYSRNSAIWIDAPAPGGFVGQTIPRAVESFDFSFNFRRVVGAMVGDGAAGSLEGPAKPVREGAWIQYADLRGIGNPLEGLLTSDTISAARLPADFSSRIQITDLHDGVYLSQKDSSLIQVRLNPGHAIGVYDYGTLSDERLARRDAKSGEVWWLDFVADTGRIVAAHMMQGDSNRFIQIPFDDLDYDASRKCFMIRKMPEVSGPSGLAAAIAALELSQRTGRFH